MSTTPEALMAELKKLRAEHKALLAENPKRLKSQVKRLQDENRAKNAEITQLKNRLKKAQNESQKQEQLVEQMEQNFSTLRVLEEPHWESEDKSWAIYLELDSDTPEGEQPDFNLRLVDRKTGGAKMPHIDQDKDGKPAISWPRMRTVPKEVKSRIDELVEIAEQHG